MMRANPKFTPFYQLILTFQQTVIPSYPSNTVMSQQFNSEATTTSSWVLIFNIYNKITNNTLQCLDQFIDLNSQLICPSISDSVIWLGDFHRHHPIWEDKANKCLFKAKNYISPLINLLYKNDMLLALPKGIPTFQTSTINWTRLDNIWCSNTTDDPIICCDVAPPLADHLPVIIILDLLSPRSSALQ